MRDIGSHGRRRPKALGNRRSGRAGDPPEGVGKPCRCPASPAASLLPGGSPARSLWVINKDLWYQSLPGPAPVIVERSAPGIEVELIGGRRVRFERDVDPETVRRLVTLLEGEMP